MTDTKKLTRLTLHDGRDERVGCNFLAGPCYICGQKVQGLYEVPGCQLAYYLCPKCDHEHLNVQLAIDGRYGWVHTHSWNGQEVQIKRSFGTLQAATVSNLQIHMSKVYFVCKWLDAGRPMHRLFPYESLMALNPNLPALCSVSSFRGIPIDVSYQEQTDAWIYSLKTGQDIVH
jgi:hypothetical protein